MKWSTLAFTAAALGIVGLVSPWALVLIPTFLWRFAGNNPYYWTILWHYSATIAPIIAVALVTGIQRVNAWHAEADREVAAKHAEAEDRRAGSHAGSGAANGTRSILRSSTPLAMVCALLALGSSVTGTASNGFGSWIMGRDNKQGYVSVYDYGKGQTPEQQQAGRGAVEAAGTGRTILTDVLMMAYVVPGNTVYWEHSYGNAYFDTVVFSNRLNHGNGNDVARWVTSKVGGSWHVVYDKFGYVVVERDGT